LASKSPDFFSRLSQQIGMSVAVASYQPLAVDNETPETLLMKRSDSGLLQKAIDNLPVHHREILLLCEVEEMSYGEIAEILSIPTGTVMSRLSRARKAVRESLHGQLSDGGRNVSLERSVTVS
jgi:RNA polymerase sigma factor (sigma-70 family)